MEIFHEKGKVNSPKEKVKGNLIQSGKHSLTSTLHIKDMEEGMQWETIPDNVARVKSKEVRQHMHEIKSMGFVDKENLDWAEIDSSPLAMIYNQTKGWISKILGPKSGHWKCLDRKVKGNFSKVDSDPASPKRKGETPLIELDPNVNSKKRTKGKAKAENTLNE